MTAHPPSQNGETEPESTSLKPPLNTRRLDLGVWTVLFPLQSAGKLWDLPSLETIFAVTSSLPIIWRFVKDVHARNQLGTNVFFLLFFLGAFEDVLLMYTSTRLLRVVEAGLRQGAIDVSAVAEALAFRVFLIGFFGTMQWAREYISPLLQSRVKLFFENKLLQVDLSLDLPTAAETTTRASASSDEAWGAFVVLTEVAQRIFVLLMQLLFVAKGHGGGYIFSLLILVHPLVKTLAKPAELYWTPNLVYSENQDYARLKSLAMMAHDYYRQDVLLGGLAGWIGTQFRAARDALGSIPTEHAVTQYSQESTPLVQIAVELVGQLPTLYWVYIAIRSPANISMAAIALLSQYSGQVRYSVQMVFYEFGRASKHLSDIRLLYEGENIENVIVDGEKTYPRPEWEWTGDKGMDVQFENVSFSYPGSKTTSDAIQNLSFHIPAGALAVIVGTNGSGKSTLIKLLARLYDPISSSDENEELEATSGRIIVDGLEINEYRLADLRRAQAHLTQELQLFPLSIRENVALGAGEEKVITSPTPAVNSNPTGLRKRDPVKRALSGGGAKLLVQRFEEGEGTVLEPVRTVYEQTLDDERFRELRKFGAEIEKAADVSGGERQRLIASRTFMRLQLPGIKLLCVDEPSSALDPRGEYDLFQRLRNCGAGITKIFVTHRFGHLTRHADVIICMKEGRIEEIGTHAELIGKGGEYAELYNLQARAFVEK
ncbi:P-loop containing nucleoside triphosphate hydrolase protein [Mycena kentingensis (nom. inval.)]|nr:P-loop containing nucleoside triphosphate hydrolase protein [Mycena kentingensis (nom. inval.)]